MNHHIFWERVNEQIKAHNITKEKFAAYIGVPAATFYGWQQKNRIPDVLTAYDIANALGVDIEYLVTGEKGVDAKLRMKQTYERKCIEAEVKKLSDKLQESVMKL